MSNWTFTSGTPGQKVTTTYTYVFPEDPWEWLARQPWYVRLDEWQHSKCGSARAPRFYLWYWSWKPICWLAERHHARNGQ